jgi:hypothetical protein
MHAQAPHGQILDEMQAWRQIYVRMQSDDNSMVGEAENKKKRQRRNNQVKKQAECRCKSTPCMRAHGE